MENVSPTRMNLLITKRQMALAEQGADLLKRKRDALIREFFQSVQELLDSRARLEDTAREAFYSLSVSKAVDGTVMVRSAGYAAQGQIELQMASQNVMGVRIPVVERRDVVRSVLARGYSIIGVSSRIDETANRFERELALIIELAGVETRIIRLSDAIRKTNRRVNALEQVIMPSLKERQRMISRALEERERENVFALKRVKKKIERQSEAAERIPVVAGAAADLPLPSPSRGGTDLTASRPVGDDPPSAE